MCPTAQTYQNHQIQMGIQEAASGGGLYTRIVLNDFLPEYPGRAPFEPGLSEYGATKPWAGSPMAALQRAVIMMRRLNLRGIPRDIRKGLRDLQDIYSEPIDLNEVGDSDDGGADIEPEEDEEWLWKGKEAHSNYIPTVPENKAGDRGTGNVEGRRNDTGCWDEVDKARLPLPEPRRVSPSSPLRSDSSRLWRWGPGATSKDAMKFFRAVI